MNIALDESFNEEYEEMKSPIVLEESDPNQYIYDNVPESWYNMSVDLKYNESCVTLEMLSKEQKRIQCELQTHMLALQVIKLFYFDHDVVFPLV